MALPVPPSNDQPIPNNPFYYPLNSFIQGDYGPLIVGSGLYIDYFTSTISSTGGGGGGVTSLTAGPGIAVSGGGVGNVLVSNTGVLDILPGYGITITNDGFGNYTVANTSGSGTVTAITAGPGLTGGTITTSGTIALPNLFGVPSTTATYPASVTVDNFGRVTSLTPGTPPFNTNVFTAKGQLIASAGPSTPAILGAGANGCVLVACSACSLGVTWGNPAYPVSSVTATSPIVISGTLANPVVSINPATTLSCGAVQLNNTLGSSSATQALTALQGCCLQQQINALTLNAGTVTSVTGTAPVVITGNASCTPNVTVTNASTSALGVVQLNNTTTCTSISQALTACMGKYLQDQISGIQTGMVFAGTINGATGLIATVSSSGQAAGFVVGSTLPAATPARKNYFIIITTSGTMTPPGGVATAVTRGDWWLCDGASWQYIDVGGLSPYSSTSEAGVICLATGSEVRAGLNDFKAVTPSTLQSKVSDSVLISDSLCIASSTAVKCAYDTALAAFTCVAGYATSTCAGLTCFSTAAETIAGIVGNKAIVPSGLQAKMSNCCGCPCTNLIASSCAVQLVCDIAIRRIPCSAFTAQAQVLVGASSGAYTAVGPLSSQTCGYTLITDYSCPGGVRWGLPTSTSPATPICIGTVFGCTYFNANSSVTLGWEAICTTNSLSLCTSNVAIGTRAGRNVGLGACNTLIGTLSGTSLVSGNCNIFLGFQSGCAVTTGSNNILIGNQVNPTTSGANSCLILGQWLSGDNNCNVKPAKGLLDQSNCLGTSGQVLTSTGTALQWANSGLIDVYQFATRYGCTTGGGVGEVTLQFMCGGLPIGWYQVSVFGYICGEGSGTAESPFGHIYVEGGPNGGTAVRSASAVYYEMGPNAQSFPWSVTVPLVVCDLNYRFCARFTKMNANNNNISVSAEATAFRIGNVICCLY